MSIEASGQYQSPQEGSETQGQRRSPVAGEIARVTNRTVATLVPFLASEIRPLYSPGQLHREGAALRETARAARPLQEAHSGHPPYTRDEQAALLLAKQAEVEKRGRLISHVERDENGNPVFYETLLCNVPKENYAAAVQKIQWYNAYSQESTSE
jgi:hypothetical protein